MKILALITARGGSKRLPGKNIRNFGGQPLINWSIEVAKNNNDICEILISTDDPAIADVCKKAGAFVPWLRPSELATDVASSVDVALHALNWYESEKGPVDGLLLLQPTSPLRTRATIQKAIALFREHASTSVLAVSPTPAHPLWMFKIEGEVLVPYSIEIGLNIRSQDLPPVYVVNGSCYLISPTELRLINSFISAASVPLVIDSQHEAIDIDTEWDWAVAEAALLALKSQQTQALLFQAVRDV